MSESDPEQETVQSMTRAISTALMGATQIAERARRQREQETRDAETASQQRAAELRQRLTAEKTAAAAVTGETRRRDFWDHASTDDVARAWSTAVAWSDRDPGIDADRRRIADEVRTRYGVDADQLLDDVRNRRDAAAPAPAPETAAAREPIADVAGVAAVQHAISQDQAEQQRAEADQAEAATARSAALADRGVADVQRDVAAGSSTGDGPAQEAAADARYDSAQRRLDDADRLRASGAPEEAVTAQRLAATGQAKPATEATAQKPTGLSSPSTTPAGITQQQRRGRSR